MVSNFFLQWSQLNFFSLFFTKPKHLANLNILFETVTYFEYGKTKKKYWTGKHLFD